MRTLLIGAALLAGAALNAQAGFVNGDKLYDMLREDDTLKQIQGLGYVQGVVDAQLGVALCVPVGITSREVMNVVRDELRSIAPAARRSERADLFVILALRRLYPCNK